MLSRRTCLLTLISLGLTSSLYAAEVRVVKKKDSVDFFVGKELAGTYNFSKSLPKPIIYPLNAPGKLPVTRAYPIEKDVPKGGSKDHVHHQSVWFCHGDVIPEGIKLKHKIRGVEGVDFWSVHEGHGLIVCTKVGKPEVDGNHAWVTTHNEWRTADGQKVMDETRTIHFFDFGKSRLFIFEIDLDASVVPIVFGDTKEGSMAVRVHDSISERRGDGVIQNALGKRREKECWGRHADWCDYSGTIAGRKVGVAILSDPKNPHKTAWHSRGYGLMGANPFGRKRAGFPAVKGRTDLVRLKKGEHLVMNYGVLVHDGDTKSADVAGMYEKFVKLCRKVDN